MTSNEQFLRIGGQSFWTGISKGRWRSVVVERRLEKERENMQIQSYHTLTIVPPSQHSTTRTHNHRPGHFPGKPSLAETNSHAVKHCTYSICNIFRITFQILLKCKVMLMSTFLLQNLDVFVFFQVTLMRNNWTVFSR